MTKVQKIQKEYGSFKEAVAHYAEIGCSQRLTAKTLGMDRRHFLRTLRRFRLEGLFTKDPKRMLPECRPGHRKGGAPWLRHGSDKKYTDDELLLWVGQCRTTREFNEKSPYNAVTVFDRFGSWLKAKDLARQKKVQQRHIELYGESSWQATQQA